MSDLIEEYKKAKARVVTIKNIVRALFESDPRDIDKKHYHFHYQGSTSDWRNSMAFQAGCYWGHYGHSGCSDRGSEAVGVLLAKAINRNAELIYSTAIAIAEEEEQEALIRAKTDADMILTRLAEVENV